MSGGGSVGGPVVSFVVPTVGRASHLAGCLASIRETVRAAHEVIVVTVEGDAETADVLAGLGESVRVVTQAGRVGFVKAANAGFRACRGEWVCQLNDDCELMPHCVDNALLFASAGAHADADQIAFFHDTPVARNVHQEVTVEGVRYVVTHVRGLPFANFGLTRRSVLEALGYYDERFFMYGADPDLSLLVWLERGGRVLPCPGALVRHAELADERGAEERGGQDADNRLLFEKWGLAGPGG